MFCPECGEKLIKTGQKFCHNCGTEVLATSEAIDYKLERTQNVSVPKIQYIPIKPQKQLKMGPPGKYSKFCLEFALISIVIGIATLIIGYNYFRFFYYPSHNIIGRLVVLIVILLLRVGGLILGVFSRINSSKAQIFEPYNDVEKAGSIFGIFGIIINAIGLSLSILGPWSVFTFPY